MSSIPQGNYLDSETTFQKLLDINFLFGNSVYKKHLEKGNNINNTTSKRMQCIEIPSI